MLVNALLRRLGGEMRVEIVALDWENGALHVREVSTLHVPSARRIASVNHLEWRPRWSELRAWNLGGVKAEGATVDVPQAWLLPSAAPAGDSAPGSSPRWRLELVDLAPTKFVVRDADWKPVFSVIVAQKLEALEIGGSRSLSFQSVVTDLSEAEWHGKPVLSRLHLESVMHEDSIEMRKISLRGGQVDLAWLKEASPALSEKLPPLRGGVQFEWEGRDMRFSGGGLSAGGTHEVHLKKLQLQPQSGAGMVRVEAVDVKASQDAGGLWHVRSGLVESPVIEWTRELEEALLPKGGSASKTAWKVSVDGMEVKDGRVVVSKTEMCPVMGAFAWSTRLSALEVSADGARSSSRQQLTLAELSLGWGQGTADVKPRPFALLKGVALEVTPDKLRESWLVDSLVMKTPRFEFTPENGPWFDKVTTEPVKPVVDPPELKPWQRVRFGHLSVSEASVAVAMKLAERMESETKFEIATEGGQQRLHVTSAQVRVPQRSPLPVLGLEDAEAVVSLPEMWQQRHIESLKLSGGQVEAGEALMTLFKGDAAVVETKAKAAASRWTAGKVDVQRLGVTLVSIAPGLPPVRFDVNFNANETPLDLDGLAENVSPQRIMLTRLRIPSPHEPLRTVAEMDVIHVDYTLDGLLHRRIDRVEIVSPLLYVGEDMFWYVENYRKLMKGEPPPADATFGPPLPPKPPAPGWRVDTLAVSDGRLLLAPKGVPLKGFGKPFPFSFTSRLESGQLDAVFDIPSDNYTLAEMKLEFRGMKGHVRFNLPMKDRNNNLTETFTVEQLRWKQLHIEKAHLSVTYDAHGIYGMFGGAAYDGYVNGAFDIFLDDAYTWDGWVSGVGVNLGPVTKVLFPDYLLIDGAVQGKVIATGNMNELYQADAEFSNRSRGRFSIAALNDMLKTLPPRLKGDIADQIMRIGLETLRDFDYESVDGKARFYGREGRGHLRLTGPHGARKFDIHVYDHRWKEEPSQTAAAASNDE